jgi:hypothetical protein
MPKRNKSGEIDGIQEIRKGDPVTVYWIDADLDTDRIWHDADYEPDFTPVKTRGYFVSQTPEVLAVCSSVANLPIDEWPDQDCFGGIWRIPSKFIVSIDFEVGVTEVKDE